MKPPPSTPTPRRFLPKRHAPSQLSQPTPTPLRFQSTPRFGSAQSAARHVEDVDDIEVGSSQTQSQPQPQSSAPKHERPDGRGIMSDSIEVDSCMDSPASQKIALLSSGSSDDEEDEGDDLPKSEADAIEEGEGEAVDDDASMDRYREHSSYEEQGEEDSPVTPPLKRRRLSSDASPTGGLHMNTAYDSDAVHGDEEREVSGQEDEGHDIQDKTRTRAFAPQQPTFHSAPRFMRAPEDDPSATHDQDGALPLLREPYYNSPQRRRGAKYIAGGLAAQLQGLLSQVKGSETLGGGSDAEGVVRLAVEEVGPGTRMHLVRGRVLSRGAVAVAEEREGVKMQRYILAGGAGGGGGVARMVREGSVLRIMAAPAWDVFLGDENWTVACEWSVESLDGANES